MSAKQATNVVRIKRKRRARGKSVYDLYPMPFFNSDRRALHSLWNVTPTGDYSADCDTGHRFGIEFLKSCDGTVGWSALVRWIILDIIHAGPDGFWRDGGAKSNGIVVGFLGVIGNAVNGFATYGTGLVSLMDRRRSDPPTTNEMPSRQGEVMSFRPRLVGAEVQS
jgi:hypothetical protein